MDRSDVKAIEKEIMELLKINFIIKLVVQSLERRNVTGSSPRPTL